MRYPTNELVNNTLPTSYARAKSDRISLTLVGLYIRIRSKGWTGTREAILYTIALR